MQLRVNVFRGIIQKVAGMPCTHPDQFHWRSIDGLTIDIASIRHRGSDTPQKKIGGAAEKG